MFLFWRLLVLFCVMNRKLVVFRMRNVCIFYMFVNKWLLVWCVWMIIFLRFLSGNWIRLKKGLYFFLNFIIILVVMLKKNRVLCLCNMNWNRYKVSRFWWRWVFIFFIVMLVSFWFWRSIWIWRWIGSIWWLNLSCWLNSCKCWMKDWMVVVVVVYCNYVVCFLKFCFVLF